MTSTSAFSFPVSWCDPLQMQVQCCDISTSVFSSDGDSLMLLLKLLLNLILFHRQNPLLVQPMQTHQIQASVQALGPLN